MNADFRDAHFGGTSTGTSDIRGPFLLVDSLDALNDPVTGDPVAFRCWLGVAAGVFIGGHLHIYTVAHPNTEADGSQYLDGGSGAVAAAAIADFNDGAGFATETIFRRIHRDVFLSEIAGAGASTDEVNWTTRSAVPGEVNRPVRHWVAMAGNATGVEKMEDLVASYPMERWAPRGSSPILPHDMSPHPPSEARIFDPSPIVQDDRLGMFVAIRPTFRHELLPWLHTAYGIWLFRAIDPSTVPWLRHGSELVRVVFGLDLLVDDRAAPFEPGAQPGERPDQVATAGRRHDFADPDAVFNTDTGRWYVFTHNGVSLVVFELSPAAVGLDARNAW